MLMPCSFSFPLFFDLPVEVILSAILFPIKSPLVYAVFWTTLSDAVFAASTLVFVAVSINFLPYVSQIFLQILKTHNLQYIFFFLGQFNISFILTCHNY